MVETRFMKGGGLSLRKEDDGSQFAEGYGIVFYNAEDAGTEYQLWDDFIERIDPQCKINYGPMRSFVNHDPNQMLSRLDKGTMTVKRDARGMFYSSRIPDTAVGRDCAKNLENGNLDGSSFSFNLLCRRREDTKIGDRWVSYRYITEMEVIEMGPVSFPAYKSTSAGVAVRSCGDEESIERARQEYAEIREQEMQLRHAEEMDVRMALMRCDQSQLLSDLY